MSKVKLSNIIADQFPEFIRSDYPTFIAFVEAYYEFLQRSSYDLSEIRDIDQTLDIFIDQFKSELASNLPTQTLLDQRKLLQHLKDQYLAKGTEASYKFLFRILFDKEVDVQYPGQQMLRASDGRWSQDVTIFARIKRGVPTDVYGQYIDVITPNKVVQIRIDNWRWATVYQDGIPRVSEDIVELFIDKRFYGTISYDYTIKFGDTFEATILPTTSNIKIVNRGRGFKAGQLYRIKSSLGDGSILKVSRVNEDGGIASAQLIKFGTGYQTDFIAAISPPVGNIYEPLSIIGDTISVKDRTGGFIESGLITYNDYATDAWISTYNGKVLREFYYDDKEVPDPANAATLRVTLGALARYPGYYTSNLGFLDDAIYIQDGHYYQSFSYLLKIDERISKYRDVVKTLLHPAGMALFGGYELKSEFNALPEIISYLTFIAYKLESALDGPTDILTEIQFGKALDDIQLAIDNISFKGISKPLSETLDELTDSSTLSVNKPLLDSISEYAETVNKEFGKRLTDSNGVVDTVNTIGFGKSVEDSVGNTDSTKNDVSKALSDSLDSPTDDYAIRIEKQAQDSFAVSDSSTSIFGKAATETILSSDNVSSFNISKSVSEEVILTEIPVITISKTFTDEIFATDQISDFAKLFETYDSISAPTDNISSIGVNKSFSDDASSSETLSMALTKSMPEETISHSDTALLSINKGISDSAQSSELGFVELNPYIQADQFYIVFSEQYVGDRTTF